MYKIGHEVGPHVTSMHTFHFDPEGNKKSTSPTGHIGYDIHYHEKNRDEVDSALSRCGSHGHIAEDYSTGDDHRHAYGYVTAHGKGRNLSKSELVKALDEAGHTQSALLVKNWGELDSMAELVKANLEKKINESSFGSPHLYENRADVEGGAKSKKYQGGDPRHEERGEYTRAGKQREFVDPYTKNSSFTSGESDKRSGTKNDPYTRDYTWDKQGKKVPWNK